MIATALTPSAWPAWLRLPVALASHLKRGTSGHLLRGAAGHLARECGGCCLSCPQSPTLCIPTQWTVTFSGVTMDTTCQDAGDGFGIPASGDINGTYTVPSYPISPTNIWQTTSSNAQFSDDGDCSPPDQPMRIRVQDNSGTLTIFVDGGAVDTDIRFFNATIATPAGYPCVSMTFTNSIVTCGTDGFHYDHGCGGIAVVSPC